MSVSKTCLLSLDIRKTPEGTDSAILIAGEKKPGKDITIIKSFAGDEAIEIATKIWGKEVAFGYGQT